MHKQVEKDHETEAKLLLFFLPILQTHKLHTDTAVRQTGRVWRVAGKSDLLCDL
jgi:hypothetical protein